VTVAQFPQQVIGAERAGRRLSPTVTILQESRGPVIAIGVTGKMTVEDYHQLRPLFVETIQRYSQLRLLFRAEHFSGWSDLRAALEDAQTMLRVRKHLERVAVVTNFGWKSWLARASEPFIGGRVRVFNVDDDEAAWRWIFDGAPAEENALSDASA
jgi:hypothetical protein